MKANDLHNFRFVYAGSGCVRVTYFTDKRGDFWRAYIDDMDIIDATKDAEWAKAKDIERLRHLTIHNGIHYSRMGKRLDK